METSVKVHVYITSIKATLKVWFGCFEVPPKVEKPDQWQSKDTFILTTYK